MHPLIDIGFNFGHDSFDRAASAFGGNVVPTRRSAPVRCGPRERHPGKPACN